jgi:hypothetical protein
VISIRPRVPNVVTVTVSPLCKRKEHTVSVRTLARSNSMIEVKVFIRLVSFLFRFVGHSIMG